MELDLVRKELNTYDEAIKNLITLRMSLIPIVADTKVKNNLPLVQTKRENEIYARILDFADNTGVSAELLKNIYKLIISNALEIEDDFVNNSENYVINKDYSDCDLKKLKEKFEKLDYILNKTLPNLIKEIEDSSEFKNLKLLDKSSIYYNYKIERLSENN